MDIRRRFLSKKSYGGSSGGDSSGTYTVNLNSQWEKTTAVTNPDYSLYDGVYRSSSSYNVNSGVSIMYITLTGYSTFKLYIRSYAESNYDYVMVSQLDKTITGSSSYSDTSLVKAHTRGNQQSGTALSNYTLVEYTGISSGSHTITIVYRKDGSVNNGDDRGYVLIPKSQEGGGDVDIDTTYSIMYTSSDGNVVTPFKTNVFGANITSNTYVNGQGIITFDGPVTTIRSQAFYGCTSLTSVTLGNSVTSIGTSVFQGCNSLTSVTIPNRVTSIGGLAFYGCTSLTSVTIPDSVTTIGEDAFGNCNSLPVIDYIRYADTCLVKPTSWTQNTYTIKESTKFISMKAFYGYNKVTSITISQDVINVGAEAFYNCSALTTVYCKPSIPPKIYKGNRTYWNAFNGTSSNLTIYVPTASVDAYKSATGWKDYASNIVGYDFEDDGGSSELITFSIDGVQYQAEEGMTWLQWCDSEYNVDHFQKMLSLNWVSDYSYEYFVYLENTIVGLADTILQNTNYVLKS